MTKKALKNVEAEQADTNTEKKTRGRGCKRKVDDEEDDDYDPDAKKPKTKTQKKTNAEQTKKARKEDPATALKKQIKDGEAAATRILNAQHAANKLMLKALSAQALGAQLLLIAEAQRTEHGKFDVFAQKPTLASFIRLGQKDASDTTMAEDEVVEVEPVAKSVVPPVPEPAPMQAVQLPVSNPVSEPVVHVPNPTVPQVQKPEVLPMPKFADLSLEAVCYYCKKSGAIACNGPKCTAAFHRQCIAQQQAKVCPSCGHH